MKGQFNTFFTERESLLKKLHVRKENFAKHEAFLDFLWLKNQTHLNIVSRKMPAKDLFEKHLLDSFLALPLWPKEVKKIADLGSGGGFPAIPFAIENPAQSFTLYEKSQKKQRYLNALIAHLKLNNVNVQGHIDKPTGFDLIIARAFKPTKDILSICSTHQGAYFLFKATIEKINAELEGIDGAEIIELDTYDLDMQRHIVIL